MKDKKSIYVSSSTENNALVNLGLKAVLTRKNNPKALILRRLREYLLYSKLRSLIPPQPSQLGRPEGETEVKLEPHEIPEMDYSDNEPQRSEVESQEEEGEEKDLEEFVPSIKIKRMDDLILISTVVLKDIALTSDLFRVLEEEKVDIVFENQYRTETKVAHTIQVKVQPGYNIDVLEKKLCTWAGKPT